MPCSPAAQTLLLLLLLLLLYKEPRLAAEGLQAPATCCHAGACSPPWLLGSTLLGVA